MGAHPALVSVPTTVPTAEQAIMAKVPSKTGITVGRQGRKDSALLINQLQRMTRERTRRRVTGSGGRAYSRYANEVLEFFSRHRTALAHQVRRYFADTFRLDRTTRLHLQTLVAAHDLVVHRERGIGEPNVYLITSQGLRRTADVDDSQYAIWRRQQRGSHLLHELLITEFAVMLREAVRQRADLVIPWEERCAFTSQHGFGEVIPDFGFLFKHATGMLACLVEVSSGEESPTRLGQKLRRYEAWAETPEAEKFLTGLYRQRGAKNPRPHFRLLILVQNRRTGNDASRHRQLLVETLKLSSPMRRRIWSTTGNELLATRENDQPLWVRTSDIEVAVPDFSALPRRQQRPALTAALAQVVRLPLFPERSSHG